MAEYIERESLLADIDSAMDNAGMWHVVGQTLNRYIKRQPAADVVEVKRGRWEDANDFDGIVCSVCKEDFCVLINETERFKCCPNCGARMDGE